MNRLCFTRTILCKIKFCTVHVDADEPSHDVQLIVDTGSSVSILHVSMHQNLFLTCEHAKPTVTLCTHSKEKIPVTGW